VNSPQHDDIVDAASTFEWRSIPKFRDRRWLHVMLLVLTIGSTTLDGVDHYLSFLGDFSGRIPTGVPVLRVVLGALSYSGTILAILGCHELGHYIACRYYDVDASLPFFIPVPFLLTGTMGAFIRIREPIPSKRMLFDIGIAGPIAGFLVAVPTLIAGLAMSHVVRIPPDFRGVELGEPLLFKIASTMMWGTQGAGYSLNLHPMAFAAWFGLLATALNLFPVGQLDGGHICYAVLGRFSTHVTIVTVGVALALVSVSTSWVVWTTLMIGMLLMFGPRHPRTIDEDVPLDRPRLMLAIVALVMFGLCFTPAPIGPTELLGR
jgi:membrane-associated protease RseP (regulator of RpoE activity)